MIKKFLPVFIAVFSLGSLSAQSFNVNVNRYFSVNEQADVADTVKILAVMVSFQEDRDGTTFGNGKFGSIYSQDYGSSILDPLPHDQPYFEDHLLFVKNYFNRVSKGNLHVEYTVLPDTFSVSKTMRNYSPQPNSDDFTPLADFSVEAWTIADQMYPGFDFSAYNLFTVFHAGAGRDISLPGSIGNERDLPSVYLSEKTFKNIYGESFDGIPVSGGSFKIKNSMIMPETESRELSTIGGTVLFEITINGLIAASVGSHIGLPDLFDTETGLSAIGRFGLMDGQGIFAYSGTYPPEPSPWSKIYMGWAEPVTVNLENANVSLVTNLSAELGDTVILKVPLNSSEYFLIENRKRDAHSDGSMVTYKVNGNTITKIFTQDTTGYQSFDVDSLEGVIIDVDEFDWAVPGNGIVIWHIDENVINQKIAENKINTDKNRRGVHIEEADGIQDIGERFITIFGDEVIGEGTDEDFWHASNPSELFTNRFAKDTRPNTKTNSGANSLITIKDFSEIDNRMSFKVEFGDSIVKPLLITEIPYELKPKHLSTIVYNNKPYFVIVDSTYSLYIFEVDSMIYAAQTFSNFKPASSVENNILHTYGNITSSLLYRIMDGNSSFSDSVDVGRKITSPILLRKNSSNDPEILAGTDYGQILIYHLGGLPNIDPDSVASFTIDTLHIIKQIASQGDYFAFITDSKILSSPPVPIKLFYDSKGNNYSFTGESLIYLAVTKDRFSNDLPVILTDSNNLYVFNSYSNSLISKISLSPNLQVNSFALADLKQDGTNYIVLNNGNNIEAYNLTGAMADNFPFTDPQGIGFEGTPLTADFEGDNNSEIISVTKDGRIFAIDGGTGKVVPGFPISCGSGIPVTPVLYNANGKTNLAVLNDQNVLSAWSISSVEGKLYWSEEFGNPQNTSFIDAARSTNRINEFFPSNRAYNYPNPVYDGETNIRYYVSEDSKINIKIFDLAGDYVAELNDEAQGGMDNETLWNVADIQSGVYLARIEATSTAGRSEFAIIKIAVVK